MPLGHEIHSCVNLSNLCFCPFPITVHGFSKSPSKWEQSWWSIHNTTLFLLHFSTLSWIVVFVYMKVKDTFTWEVTNKSRIAPVQTAAKPVKKLLWRAVSRISLINQQSNPTAITCQYYEGNTPDSQTADLRSLRAQVSPTWTQATKKCRLVVLVV